MELTLRNYKNHTKSIFKFESGLNLLIGNSGNGKSSICNAIMYVLGITQRSIITFGKTSCTVTLKCQDPEVSVTRTSRPNRIVLKYRNIEVEDDEARSYIEKIFGRDLPFFTYLAQNAHRSFITLSPKEQLACLENIAFSGDVGLENLKSKIYQYKVDAKNIHQSTVKEIERCERSFKDVENKYFSEEKHDLVIFTKEDNILLETTKKELENKKNEKNTLIKNIKLLGMLERKETLLKQLQQENTNLNNSPYKGDETLNKLKQWNIYREHLQTLTNVEESARQELKKITCQKVWVDHSKEDTRDLLRDLKEYKMDILTINKHNEFLKGYDLEKERNKAIFSCPSCKENVRFRGTYLEKVNSKHMGSTDTDLELLKKLEYSYRQVKELTSKYENIKPLTEVCEDIKYLEGYYTVETRKENDIKVANEKLRTNTLSNFHTKLCSKVQNLKSSLDYSFENILYSLQLKEKELYDQIRLNIQRLELEIENITHKTMSIDTNLDNKSLKVLDVQIKTLEQRLDTLQTKQLNSVRYSKYKMLEDSFIASRDEKKLQEENEQIAIQDYRRALKLSELFDKAESLALNQTLTKLNNLLSKYLDHLFETHPITLLLSSTKTGKNGTKVQLNTSVFYKNSETDLKNLSGGEYRRVVIAFTLALAELLNSKFLILDEGTTGLSENLTTKVFNIVKESFGDRTVIVVAHQVVTGIFDNIISV